jgi:hypothetical protein
MMLEIVVAIVRSLHFVEELVVVGLGLMNHQVNQICFDFIF